MERNEFIKLAQASSAGEIRLVEHNGIAYIPSKYIMWFDKKGTPCHSVELKAVNANSVTVAPLDRINILSERTLS